MTSPRSRGPRSGGLVFDLFPKDENRETEVSVTSVSLCLILKLIAKSLELNKKYPIFAADK